MLDWINSASTQVDASLWTLILRLVVAWICGLVVAGIARRGTAADSLSLTLVLMSILIAMATQIIGDNIARAFSLVGALSIVRFRTAVPATRDMAFVLAAVVVGMAAGAGQYWVCALGLATVAMATRLAALLGAAALSGAASDGAASAAADTSTTLADSAAESQWTLTLQVGLHAIAGWQSELDRLTQAYQLRSAETTRRGGALELAYRYTPRPGVDAAQVVAALNALPMVESAAAKELSGA